MTWGNLNAQQRRDEYAKQNLSYGTIAGGLGISRGNVGAIAELMVCENLLRKGYEVFRAVSPNSKCDIVAIDKSGKCIQIEVKAAKTHLKTGTVYAVPLVRNRFDVLALVTIDGIRYVPPLEEVGND